MVNRNDVMFDNALLDNVSRVVNNWKFSFQ